LSGRAGDGLDDEAGVAVVDARNRWPGQPQSVPKQLPKLIVPNCNWDNLRRRAAQTGLVDVDAFIRDGYVVIRDAFGALEAALVSR